MKTFRIAVATMAAAVTVVAAGLVGIGQQPQPTTPTLSAPVPIGAKGEQVFPAFEGWGPHVSGAANTNYLEIGYFNRNKDEVIDVPIGPNNRIEPGGPDLLQPTHFEPGRVYGVFSIPVTKEMGNRKYTWTLVTNGKTAQVVFWTNPQYWVDFFKHAAKGNTPPKIKFAENGPELSGPPVGVAQTLTATVNQPLKLTLWARDAGDTYDPEEALPADQRSRGRGRGNDGNDARGRGRGDEPQNWDLTAAAALGTGTQNRAGGGGGGGGRGEATGPQPDITVNWKVHRGSSPVKFADAAIRLFTEGDATKVQEASTTATFSTPGEYMLRAQVNDRSGNGGGGDLCCWTNALVKVTVK